MDVSPEEKQAFEKEIHFLKQEISRLQTLLEQAGIRYRPQIDKQQTVDASDNAPSVSIVRKFVTKHSELSDKISLFMSLFHGRDDVYAKRWENQRTRMHCYEKRCGASLYSVIER